MKKTYLIVAVLLAILIGFQIIGRSPGSKIRSIAVDLSRVPLRLVTKAARKVHRSASFQNRYEQRISQLEAEIVSLKGEVLAAREVVEENERLRSLLSFKRRHTTETIAAEVIGRDPANWESFIIIDKGARDGIRPQTVVVKDKGLIGTVFDTGEHTAKVMLIDNPNSRIGAIIQRTREECVLVGLGGGLCKIMYLAYDTDVEVGDSILMSRSKDTSLRGILIGRVARVVKDPHALYASAVIEPSCNLFKIEEVLCTK